MIVKTTYISFDDEEFETEEECLAYEESTKYERSMLLFDVDCKAIKDPFPDIAFERAHYIYILNAELAKEFFKWIDSYAGYSGVRDPENKELYRYDEREDDWKNLPKEIEELLSIQMKIVKQIDI